MSAIERSFISCATAASSTRSAPARIESSRSYSRFLKPTENQYDRFARASAHLPGRSTPTLATLPDDLLMKIFFHTPCASLSAVSCTCKQLASQSSPLIHAIGALPWCVVDAIGGPLYHASLVQLDYTTTEIDTSESFYPLESHIFSILVTKETTDFLTTLRDALTMSKSSEQQHKILSDSIEKMRPILEKMRRYDHALTHSISVLYDTLSRLTTSNTTSIASGVIEQINTGLSKDTEVIPPIFEAASPFLRGKYKTPESDIDFLAIPVTTIYSSQPAMSIDPFDEPFEPTSHVACEILLFGVDTKTREIHTNRCATTLMLNIDSEPLEEAAFGHHSRGIIQMVISLLEGKSVKKETLPANQLGDIEKFECTLGWRKEER